MSYYGNVRLFCSVGMRNGMRGSVLGDENVYTKCDESADGGGRNDVDKQRKNSPSVIR